MNILTWPSIIFATAIGARNPAVLATQLVIPIKVPAKLGAISIWLQLIEINENPLHPTHMQINATTRVLSQPANFIRTNARAGIKNAVKGKNILVFVLTLNRNASSIVSYQKSWILF